MMLDAADCNAILEDFHAGEIKEMNTNKNYAKTFVTRTVTAKPFYLSTHHKQIDVVRARAFRLGYYYEKELTKHVAETFEEKKQEGKETIMLNVGGNVGWFSLVAAAYGATKVTHLSQTLQILSGSMDP